MAFNSDEMSPTGPVWHASWAPAAIPAPAAPSETGRRALQGLLDSFRNAGESKVGARWAARENEAAANRTAWADMPQLYRRMVVAAAGLPDDVVGRRDRELTEREKVMMRSAICDMRTWLSSVAAL